MYCTHFVITINENVFKTLNKLIAFKLQLLVANYIVLKFMLMFMPATVR